MNGPNPAPAPPQPLPPDAPLPGDPGGNPPPRARWAQWAHAVAGTWPSPRPTRGAPLTERARDSRLHGSSPVPAESACPGAR